MAKLKAIFIAAAFVVGTANVAGAADLLPPPPAPAPEAPPEMNGWYLRGDVGVGFDEMSNFSSTDASIVPTFSYDGHGLGRQVFFGGGVGYQINNWFRADVTGEYRTNSKYWGVENYTEFCTVGTTCLDDYSGQVSSIVSLVNGYVDVGTWYGFTPFVGAGIGASFNRFSGLTDVGVQTGGYGQASPSNNVQLAWALMAGVSYSITPNWKVELSYRYLDMGNVTSNPIVCVAGCTYEVQRFHMASNDVRIGLRYIFAEVPPPAPPLITKY
jgi:opacity protein-like surface antigen